MRKILLIIIILAVIAAPTAVLFKDRIQSLYLSNFYPWTVRGKVIDITNSSPLDLVEIQTGSRKTFSIYDGTFELSKIKNLEKVSLIAPDLYEDYPQALECAAQPAQKSSRIAVCNTALYPTAGNITIRSEIDLSVTRAEKEGELRSRNSALWDLMEPNSQSDFSNQEIFVEALSLYNQIQRKLSLQQVSFEVELEKTAFLPEWTSPITGRPYSVVAEVPVSRTFAAGKVVWVFDHLVRVNGVWKFIPEFSLAEINRFNSVNGWVLKQKD